MNNNIGPYEALVDDWKGLFFMFHDDLVKEKPPKMVGNFDDSNVKETEEGAPFRKATDKGFLFMIEDSSPCCVPAPEMDVCDEVFSPNFDEELVSPSEKQESWFFPKYNNESTSCFPNDQNNIILNMFESFTPYFPEDDKPMIVPHQRFMHLIIDISISWLEDQIQSSRLVSFPSSKVPFYGIWLSFFPISCPHNPSYHYSHLYFLFCGKDNNGNMHSRIDQLICWFHWIYDYT